ncbi:MAG: SIS domain-containing protein [Candidatus Aminicenantes bacterium]|nr:SIS domain-containing protein [Candidatus Aminicenantes bacterium]
MRKFLGDARAVIDRLSPEAIEKTVGFLLGVRTAGGRLFFLGVGGGAANASHAAADFRKFGGFEAYAPADNVAELSARTNDEGWETVFIEWLKGSRLGAADAVFVLSVGGGTPELGLSDNIARAVDYAKSVGAKVLGVVGKDGGRTARRADACIVVPTVDPAAVTLHVEAAQALIVHLLVGDPRLKKTETKHESLRR